MISKSRKVVSLIVQTHLSGDLSSTLVGQLLGLGVLADEVELLVLLHQSAGEAAQVGEEIRHVVTSDQELLSHGLTTKRTLDSPERPAHRHPEQAVAAASTAIEPLHSASLDDCRLGISQAEAALSSFVQGAVRILMLSVTAFSKITAISGVC